ncbi:fibronectin type III domain-containing protein [Flavobacterium psychrophilum]|uniref:fibronectin type III domain-containing protein n=1 Tax=Flavobacterium psychrophilum TaxID=96345 RepID=UPI000B7C2251|nr:fibronectin type III domain-containing protein [Flavobacterium psychrophilum]MCB6089433.1 fibronectin type III domain-containing protein [Flavobacterium psychrophilum]MCB6231688.1 fibronectin type III domain-containing protein [Flavobacterium psychrophilum]SNA84754.1 conserved hypothetical protein [Flavobacterium psychrophilum]SNA88403.1 conserved hypothetical protein [Flavobacterium psychrophilum]
MTRNLYKIFFLLLSFQIFGQVYPVQITPIFNTPYSSRVSDYATSMDVKMQLLINPSDISITNRQVRLKMYLQGNNINAQSVDYVNGINPIYINGGELLTLTNLDIAALFRLENLQGISPAQYANALPEGMYNVCFEMYDYLTNQRISQKSCAYLYLMLNDPPLLNTPARNESIAVSEFPNILFTWTPRQLNATNVSYQFEIKEILDPTIDPQIGFLTSPTLYEETLYSTALLYDISKPNLIAGKRYAWRVRAMSTSGLSLNNVFKNDGYSEIYHFTYASNCPTPTFILSEALSARSVRISWQGDNSHTKYHLQYKKANVSRSEWFEVYTMNTQTTLSDLEAGVTYEFRVGGSCEPAVLSNTASFTYSGINSFSMPAAGTTSSAFTCGLNPAVAIANQTPITNLIVSETFTAGDFPVKILELTGNNPYTGKGYIVVPYLADTKIAVVFNTITVNTNYQLINGIVETTYDPTWGNVQDIQPLIDDIFAIINGTVTALQNLIVQSQNSQSPLDTNAWNTSQSALNNALLLMAGSGNYPPEVQQQVSDLTANTFLASTNTPNASQYAQTTEQLNQINALATMVAENDKGIQKLITALKSFGTDTFIKCKLCATDVKDTPVGFDGSFGKIKGSLYFGRKYACVLARLSSNNPLLVITDNLNAIQVADKPDSQTLQLVAAVKTIFNEKKTEFLALINASNELIQCSVKYPFGDQVCQPNGTLTDAAMNQIAQEVSECFVGNIEAYLTQAVADSRANQSIEFENKGIVYKLDSTKKLVIINNPISDDQINAGNWSESGKEIKIRLTINNKGILQIKAFGINKNLVLASNKTANIPQINNHIKEQTNAFFTTYKVANPAVTPQQLGITLNNNDEVFADGKKMVIDDKVSFFKILSEGTGLVTSLLKTAEVEDKTYLNSSNAAIKAPGLVTGSVEVVATKVTDLTSLAIGIYDLATDKKAQTEAWNGLTKITESIGNDATLFLPILTKVLVSAASGNTPEQWQSINNPSTDSGKKGHLVTRGTENTVITAVAGVAFVKELPEIAEKLSEKIAKVRNLANIFNNFSKTIDFGGDIIKNLDKKLNILGRVNPKNGTIGTRKIYDELIAKGINADDITGLFTQIPDGWNRMKVVDMNKKYWDEINQVHIDNIIANGGDIRFIHDPRLVENQFNIVAEMPNTDFRKKCIEEGLIKIPTFMKWEYEYLLKKGYLLQENGLMIKL